MSKQAKSGPLEGVRVVEVTTTWSGPMAGCILADFGAEVIRVEHPVGDVSRHVGQRFPGSNEPILHATVNRNKKSITLDLHLQEAQQILLKLIETTDVVIENFRKGALAGWGLGYDQCAQRKSDLVYVSITGFGQDGPYSDKVAYDPIIQFMSGWASQNGLRDSGALKAPTILADDLGGVHGALGALAALRHKDVTGEGQHVDVSMLDSMLFQSNASLTMGALGIDVPKQENSFPVVPANLYKCADGEIYISVLLDKHWVILANLIETNELASDPRFVTQKARVNNRVEVDLIVSRWCEERPKSVLLALLNDAGIPASEVATFQDAAKNPQVIARNMLQKVEIEPGLFGEIVGPPAKFSQSPTRVRSAAPNLGQHTTEVLTSLGYEGIEIEKFAQEGIT